MQNIVFCITAFPNFTPQNSSYTVVNPSRWQTRKFAAEKIGYRKVPVIIRVLKDDEAVVSMVDSNLQREMISPSEKAFA